MDNAIHWISHCPLDSAIGFATTYPLDSDLSGGWRYPSFKQLGPGQTYDLQLPRLLVPASKAMKGNLFETDLSNQAIGERSNFSFYERVS